ncbi:hypothetical protein [Acidipila rosea]|uniref:Adenosylhomocysteine nucleosidase n=1 Tax=Acidipila rosea TaxID=768535 RepID=A0A4R1L713_9BACT|nr:hypothetical protein [Acidipila rosea]TCK73975.1 adenosylhomocysteine nucleosidase [Acidipila rosea]
MTARIGIVAALPGELKPLVKGWRAEGRLYRGQLGATECVAGSAGMGAASATRACEAILREGPVTALISIGWAGALSCGVKPAQVIEIAEVIDSRTGERYASAAADPGKVRLVTLDHVARADEKRKLAERYQASMVDMEAATVGRMARMRDIPFYCYKGVSDGANDQLPDFNRFMGADGQLRMAAFIAYSALRPQHWRALMRLGENSRVAANGLARLLSEKWSHGNLHQSY